jgi:hypothetical protein
METMNSKETMKLIDYVHKTNTAELRRRIIPMELSSGWPIISIRGGRTCVTIPYFRTQRGAEGKTYLYPLSYTITRTWPDGAVIEFASLRYKKEFRGLEFGKPVGIFKHEAVKDMTKEEYEGKREQLFAYYDELLQRIEMGEEFTHGEEMQSLFQTLMEPSLYPMYVRLSKGFFTQYCGLEQK